MSGIALDLTNYHFRRQFGDIELYGTWIGEDFDEAEPCLVLMPAYRKSGVKPCCVALSAAYKYDDPRYLLAAAMRINTDLGFTDAMTGVHKIAEIIHSHLQDLIEMPPKPVRRSTVVADATVRDGMGRKVTSGEILEHE